MKPGDSVPDLDRLLMELVDGELTPAQQLHLMTLLRDDSAAREQYVEYLCLDSLLAWELSTAEKSSRGEAETLGQPVARRRATGAQTLAPKPGGRAMWSRARRGGMRSVAAGAILILLLLGLGRWRGADPRPVAIAPTGVDAANDSTREPRIGGLAILTRAVDVVWEDADSAPVVDSVLSQGTLGLRSGVLQARVLQWGHDRPGRARRDRVEGH